jgi:ribosomal protein S18 acetylase RimI-like enzyme
MINKTCLPINYPESFYKDVVKSRNENLNKFAYHNGFVVGAVCTRIEPLKGDNNPDSNSSSNSSGSRIYILTLGVLAAYRDRGIGQELVQSIIDHYNDIMDPTKRDESTKKEDIVQMSQVKEIALHVQTSNVDATKFYTEKFGFEQAELVENYYKRIDPPHCYVLRKKLQK